MNGLFGACLLVIVYAYAGYWLLLRLMAKLRALTPLQPLAPLRPAVPASAMASVSVLLTARNEAATLPAKLADLDAQTYPRECMECIVVSDGSTDDTCAIVRAAAVRAEAVRAEAASVQLPGRVQIIELATSAGKANALNLAAARATGDILVCFDARQRIGPDTVAQLVAPFADPAVGAVSGELMLVTATGEPDGDGLGIYWKLEKSVRRLESATGSVVGVTGAIYAMRRRLFEPLPPGLILDDVWLPMHAARAGGRVLFLPGVVATDRLFTGPDGDLGREWARKVRTLTGNFELMWRAPWLLTPRNPLWFRFVSHKVLRLLVPWLLLIMLAASALGHGLLMRVALGLQLLCFGLAAVGWAVPATRRWRAVGVPYTFAVLNAAVVMAAMKFLTRQQVWTDGNAGQAAVAGAGQAVAGSRVTDSSLPATHTGGATRNASTLVTDARLSAAKPAAELAVERSDGG